ncbi:hypothetical protein Bca4012_063470 [Brassica carinata]
MLITPSHRASSSVEAPESGLSFSASSSCSAKVVMLSSVLFWVVLSPPPQPSSAFSVVVAELAVSPRRQSSNFFLFVVFHSVVFESCQAPILIANLIHDHQIPPLCFTFVTLRRAQLRLFQASSPSSSSSPSHEPPSS